MALHKHTKTQRQRFISNKIRKLKKEGKSQKQSVAIALNFKK